jgi:hypothetical protein
VDEGVDVLVAEDVIVLVAGGGVDVCDGTVGGGVVVVVGKHPLPQGSVGGDGVDDDGGGGADESAIAEAATQPSDPKPMSESTVKTRAIMTRELRCGRFPGASSREVYHFGCGSPLIAESSSPGRAVDWDHVRAAETRLPGVDSRPAWAGGDAGRQHGWAVHVSDGDRVGANDVGSWSHRPADRAHHGGSSDPITAEAFPHGSERGTSARLRAGTDCVACEETLTVRLAAEAGCANPG